MCALGAGHGERVYLECSRGLISVQRNGTRHGQAGSGLEFWQVGSRILVAPQASEIGGVRGGRRGENEEYLASFFVRLVGHALTAFGRM